MEIAVVTDDCIKPGASLNCLISSSQLPNKVDTIIPILQMEKLTLGAFNSFSEATQVKKNATAIRKQGLPDSRALVLNCCKILSGNACDRSHPNTLVSRDWWERRRPNNCRDQAAEEKGAGLQRALSK